MESIRKTLRQIVKNRYFYLLFLPAFVSMAIFKYIPMYGVILAFKNFNFRQGILGSEWVGLLYFRRMLDSMKFWEVTKNTVIISCARLLWGFPAPILMAILLNEIGNQKFKKTVQTISYFPHFISWVVAAGMILEILSPSRGIVNYIIRSFGKEPIYFMARPRYFRTIVVMTGIWKEIGWGTIIYLAAIAGIDMEQYDSAHMDGANRFQIILNIVLPSIAGVVSIVLILSLGGLLNAGFDQIFNLYNDAVYSTGDIIDTYIYRQGLIDMDYSYSTAVSLSKTVIGLMMVIMSNIIIRKLSGGEKGLW